MTDDDDLREAWQRQTSKTVPERAACLDEDALVRLLAGEANPDDRQQAAQHLATCRECAEEYRLLRPLESWADEAEGVLAPGSPRRVPAAAARVSWISRSRPALAIAAALVLLVAQSVVFYRARSDDRRERARLEQQLTEEQRRSASAAQIKQELAALRQRLAELSAPQLNAPILDLEPRDAVRGADSPRTIELPKGVRLVTLVITAGGGEVFPSYALEILDSGGRVVWEGAGLARSEFDTFTLTVPAQLLPPGRLQLRLSGARGERRQHLRDYAVLVQYK